MKTIRTLFYPCSGHDISNPFDAFVATTDEFWFVDNYAYQRRLPMLPRGNKCSEQRNWVLEGLPVSSIILRCEKFQKEVELNFVSGDCRDAFRAVYDAASSRKLYAFYHRGDSDGEGGSSVYWLNGVSRDNSSDGLINLVLESLEDAGHIATDGSNALPGFQKYFEVQEPILNPHLSCDSFSYKDFWISPVGCLGQKYGPTIIWQVRKPFHGLPQSGEAKLKRVSSI